MTIFTGSFSATALEMGRLKGVKEIIVLKILEQLMEGIFFSDLGKGAQLGTGL